MTAGTGRARAPGTGLLAVVFLVSLFGIGAARAPASSGFCLPPLTECSSPAPPPPAPQEPTPAPSPLGDVPGGLGAVPGTSPPGPPAPAAVEDADAPTFTLPAAQLGGSSISFSGITAVTVVTVPLADGSRTPVLKLEADDIVIDDFLLDVRKATGPSLVTNSGRMELRGNVKVYLDSVTGTLLDGAAFTLGAATPPPGDELPPSLLKVHLGLVGVTANSITLTPSHQEIH
ncbi:hypothetical protein RCH16_001639 [Cryobacterium sp. MP_M5]|uniref:hypothetical protein n=1 Tax=unclassified Cryobacterium TaxID=2649013 RepID=UPI001A2202A2|nr:MULTISPECIES: hypothetical protein [unclassified Cryobacterium]MBG6058125.1 hypothetical protein [Cryobacterium sp. MP_M3]MEC5176631.1 hypothetical protein [Cryobacterium sp. MP_M5]